MIPVLLFPQFDPVLVQVGPFAIRWYALAYIAGIVLGWRLLRRLIVLPPVVGTKLQADDFVTWATLGIVLGGRLGYVLFYQPGVYLANPLQILQVWHGGMSFHGGAVCVPIGLGFGRVANFINGELWGRPAPDWLPWAMIFPTGGPIPRHPSQIYQALMEGLILFIVMLACSRRAAIRARFGALTGIFLAGYAVARMIGEHFREPDAFLGFLWGGITMGQLLSIPMLLAGLFLILRARPVAA
jgi:phosphatidylglycerol:prolipoprotein diacylglycerol transferase